MSRLMKDDIFVESLSGERIGPVKASVQGNKIYITNESLVLEEGGKILRPLPNGKSESYVILQVNFFNHPSRSHYEVTTRKESSLVQESSSTTININNSKGIQIGNQTTQYVVESLEEFITSINLTDYSEKQKADVKQKLKDVLSHPLTSTILGSAVDKLISML